MKKCASCGSEVSESSVLCPVCGGFTEKMEENDAENIIEKNISENSDDAITDINELLKDDIHEDIVPPEKEYEADSADIIEQSTPSETENISEKTETEPETNVKTETTPEEEVKTEPKSESEPATEIKNETPSYTSYSVPNEKGNKKNKKTPVWLVVLLILLILAISVVCAVMVVKYYTSENETAETTEENAVVSSDTISDESISDTEISDTSEEYASSETESDSFIELDTSDTVQIVETLKTVVSQNYSDVTLVYDESKDIYTINIYDAKVTEKILTIQNTSDENNEYNTLTSELTDECISCHNIILSSGLQSGVTLNIINPQDSQTLITIVNGSIEYSMIHKAD